MAARPYRRIDITGQRFGQLVAISSTHERKGGVGSIVWECRCDCGASHFVSVDKLRGGGTTRCLPCSQKRLPEGLMLYRGVLKQYRANARTRGFEWALAEDEALDLIKADCTYCGKRPDEAPKSTTSYKSTFVNYNGIDRKDSSLGYTTDNCVTCCTPCNRAKSDMSLDEWFGWLHRLGERALDIRATHYVKAA